MNWSLIIIISIAAIALIVFLVMRNQKDEKELEYKLKNDYHKPANDKGDIEIEEVMK